MHQYSASCMRDAACPILDVSFDEAVARSPLSEAAKRNAGVTVGGPDFVDLWNTMIELAGCRSGALSLGRKMANGPLMPILLACSCAPNLRVGLQRVARYKALFGPVVMVISNVRGGVRLEIRAASDDIDLPRSLAVPIGIFFVEKARNHTARQINPVFVSLPPAALDPVEAEGYFGCPLSIADNVVLEFTEKDANTRFISENEPLWREVERELEQQLQERDASRPFHVAVEGAIRLQLYSGPTHAEAVCAALGISRSTLQRRLREENRSFQDILDKVRFDLGRRYLLKSQFQIVEISRMIGFLDPKSFFRAFKNEAGMTPDEYRARHAGSTLPERAAGSP